MKINLFPIKSRLLYFITHYILRFDAVIYLAADEHRKGKRRGLQATQHVHGTQEAILGLVEGTLFKSPLHEEITLPVMMSVARSGVNDFIDDLVQKSRVAQEITKIPKPKKVN